MPLPRNKIAFTLWPEFSEEEALANLRRHLHDLTRALPSADPPLPWLMITRRHLQWNPEASFWLDVAEFERAIEREEWAEAVAYYRGDLLEGFEDEEWLHPVRERLREQFLTALERLILDHYQRRDYPRAIACARRLLTYEPFQENALRRLMMLRYEAGDRAGALQDYETFARRLRQELQAEPMPETQALHQLILREETLPAALMPVPSSVEKAAKAQTLCLPFVGRRQEMETLQARWQQARRGEGGLVLLSGLAGIGKSRLVAEFASWVEAHGGRVLKGEMTADEPLPYQALLNALRSALPLWQNLNLDPLRASVITSVLPEWSPSSSDPVTSPLPLERLDLEREQMRLFDALATLLTELARPRPLLLILEDLHLAGAATWALVEFISRRAFSHRLLLLCVYRSEEISPTHPLREVKRRLQAAGHMLHLDLAPLSLSAMQAMVEEYAHLLSEGDLGAYLYEYSEGNPFFAIEVLQDLLERASRREELLPPPMAPLPEAIRKLLAERLQRLDPETLTLVKVAAVCGLSFDVELLSEMTGWSEGSVLDHIEILLSRRMLREVGSPFAYTFSHHLLREAVYSTLRATERRRYHRRAARALAELYPTRQEELAALIAGHWEGAEEGQKAAHWYLRAARYALSLYASAEARRWLDRGLAWASDPALRFDLLALREQILAHTDALAAQQADLHEMGQLVTLLQDPERECLYLRRRVLLHRARGEREQEAEALQALGARAAGHPRQEGEFFREEAVHAMLTGRYDQAQRRLQQALALYRAQNDEAAQITCLCLLAEVALHQGDFRTAHDLLTQAMSLAERQSNRFVVFRTLETAARIAFAHQEFARARQLNQQALELAQSLGDRVGEAETLLQLATTHVRLFDVSAAELAFSQAARLYEALGRPQGRAATLVNLAVFHINLGRYPQAWQTLERAERLFAQIQDQRGEAVCAINRAVIAHYQADYAAARLQAQRGLERAQAIGSRPLQAAALIALGAAERELGHERQALEHLQAGLSLRRELGQTSDLCHDLVDLVETYLRLNDLEAARLAMEEMLTLYRAAPAGILHPQAVLWAAAKTLRALGETAQADALLMEARAMLESRAAAIPHEEARRAFLNLPFNRQLQAG
ncbi:MAG: AAA family ATPase [Anaerolineae bacterium]|nr:AAA family ATPase [Anaerolineae bacterium]